MTWTPPRGSTDLGDGYWQAPNGDLYANPEVEAGKVAANRARADREYERKVRQRPLVIAELTDRVAVLEAQSYLRLVALEAAQQLLEEKEEALRFEEGLVASLLAEAKPSVRHLREAA